MRFAPRTRPSHTLPLQLALPARVAIDLIATRLTLRRRLERAPSIPVLVRSLADAPSSSSPREPASLAPAVALAEALLTRLRVVPDTCLYRSLGRFAALRRAGIPVRFVMGVRRDGGELVGHAWLEYRGTPLGEAVDPDYVVTYSFPDAPAATPPASPSTSSP